MPHARGRPALAALAAVGLLLLALAASPVGAVTCKVLLGVNDGATLAVAGRVQYPDYPWIPLRGTASGSATGSIGVTYDRLSGCVLVAHEWTGNTTSMTRVRASEPVVPENTNLVSALSSCRMDPSLGGWTVQGAVASFKLGTRLSLSVTIPTMSGGLTSETFPVKIRSPSTVPKTVAEVDSGEARWDYVEPGYTESGTFDLAGRRGEATTTSCRISAQPGYSKRTMLLDCSRVRLTINQFDAGDFSAQLTMTANNKFLSQAQLRTASPR